MNIKERVKHSIIAACNGIQRGIITGEENALVETTDAVLDSIVNTAHELRDLSVRGQYPLNDRLVIRSTIDLIELCLEGAITTGKEREMNNEKLLARADMEARVLEKYSYMIKDEFKHTEIHTKSKKA